MSGFRFRARKSPGARQVAGEFEELETRRMRDGTVCWTRAKASDRLLNPLKRHSGETWLARLMGLGQGATSPRLRYEGLYKEWIPKLRWRWLSLRRRVLSLFPRCTHSSVALSPGMYLRIVRAPIFVRHLCELCGSDVVKFVHLDLDGLEPRPAVQLADEGYLMLQELDEGLCVEVLGRGEEIADRAAVDAERPIAMKIQVKEGR